MSTARDAAERIEKLSQRYQNVLVDNRTGLKPSLTAEIESEVQKFVADEIERLKSTIPITCDVCCEIVGPAKILQTADDLWMCERCIKSDLVRYNLESPP